MGSSRSWLFTIYVNLNRSVLIVTNYIIKFKMLTGTNVYFNVCQLWTGFIYALNVMIIRRR